MITNYPIRSLLIVVTTLLLVCNATAQHGDECPNLTISASAAVVTAGTPATFTARAGGFESRRVSYNWAVSAGTIISGQGTPTIEVDSTGLKGQNITAQIHISGDWMMACMTSASETTAVAALPTPTLLASASTAGNNCEYVLMIMDRLIAELGNDPNASGVIIIYRDAGKPGAFMNRRREVSDWMRIRGFDPTRVTIIDGTFRAKAETEFWVRPAGAEMPPVKAADVAAPAASATEVKLPYIHSSQYSDGIQGCSGPGLDPQGFAEELAANPALHGKVVVADSSQKNYRRISADIAAALRNARIKPRRVRYVFKQVKPRQLAEYAELWITK
jgi:hypothetical protein